LYNRQYAKGLSFVLVYAAGLFLIAAKLSPHLEGIVTLGEQGQHLEKVGKIYKNVPGDHSIFMMIYGVLAIFVVLLFLLFYVLNVRDAVVVGRRKQRAAGPRSLNSSFFPWMLLSLPMVGVLFFTVMPIVFTSLIAFTNYASPNHIPPKNLVDWVGFATFDKLFNLNVWSNTFAGVLTWTIILGDSGPQ